MEALTVLLTTLIGVCFLLFGRWLYLNPRKMFPAWGLLNREHPSAQKLGRVYGVFFIFFGIFASVAVSLSFLLRCVPGLPTAPPFPSLWRVLGFSVPRCLNLSPPSMQRASNHKGNLCSVNTGSGT